MRAWLSASVRRASTQRASSGPVIRQSAVTALRIEAIARHGLPQLDVPVGASAGGGAAFDGAVEGRGTPADGDEEARGGSGA
jgi:hypothetical protein